jgi:hypothetical protein
MTNLAVICIVARPLLNSMMQAALVRNVAFTVFESNPHGFETHPANVSLTWDSLEALEGTCIVKLVDCFRKPLYKAHIPASVDERLERLIGHRVRVSHPFTTKGEWTNPRMKQFEAEGRRYESCVPLVWDLQQALNKELAKESSPLLPDFYVTNEMVQSLRQIHVVSMKAFKIPNIPNDAVLLTLLQGCRDRTLQQCRDLANGVPRTPAPETMLDRMWAAVERGEDPHAVV